MPLELSVWRIDVSLQRVGPATIDMERRLEDILAHDISVASPNWMVIGRQVATPWGKLIDLLCIDSDGNIIVIELKRDNTEREIVAQLLDYGSWVRSIPGEEIPRIFNDYRKKYFPKETVSLDEAFTSRFKVKQMPDELNSSHELVIVASTLDTATERIVGYLAEQYEVNINAVFFRVFKDGDREYLTRAWLRDPALADEALPTRGSTDAKGEWNGEYYATFGDDSHRSWEDARKYGFISAGGGRWYSQTLSMLNPGDRVWVNLSDGRGYVGVGIVEKAVVPIDQFTVKLADGKEVPILQAPLDSKQMGQHGGNPEDGEFLVRVKWLKELTKAQAIKEKGLFGVQHSASRPRAEKWRYTVERLKERFGIKDQATVS